MNCGYCRDCKWWNQGDRYNWEPTDWGICLLTYRPYEGDGNDWQEHPESLARGDCGDSVVEAYLRTAPDFGCVQWERKP